MAFEDRFTTDTTFTLGDVLAVIDAEVERTERRMARLRYRLTDEVNDAGAYHLAGRLASLAHDEGAIEALKDLRHTITEGA